MKILTTLILTVTLLCGFGCATAQTGAISRAQASIEKGKYEAALRRLSEAEKYVDPKPAVKAEIVYLKGICYTGLNRPADAKGMFQYVADNFPDTEFGYLAKARLGKK